MNENITYSVVIPVYNSAKELNTLGDELLETLSYTAKKFEILFIEDCSSDNSWNVLLELSKKNKNIKLIKLTNNFGQFAALSCGITNSSGEFIITIDDDREYETKDILQLINHLHKNNLHLVYGIPEGELSPFNKRFVSIRNNFLIWLLNKQPTSSFKIFKRSIFFNDSISKKFNQNFHFEASENWIVSKQKRGAIPVSKRKLSSSKSGYHFFSKFKIYLAYNIEYQRKKNHILYILSIVSFLFVALSFALNIPSAYTSVFIFPLLMLLIGCNFYVLHYLKKGITVINNNQNELPIYVIEEKVNF